MGQSLGRREVNRGCGEGRCARKPYAAGFTLIEVLVVMFLIAVLTASVALSVGLTQKRDRDVETEGDRALALLNYAREQAELQTREYGLYVQQSGYQFLKFDPRTGRWRNVEEDDTLRARSLPAGLYLQLVVEGRPVVLRPPPREDDEEALENWLPHVMIFSNGDLTPFELTLAREGGEARARIRSTDDGTIEAVPTEDMR
jgi:general secretion pathway protein H